MEKTSAGMKNKQDPCPDMAVPTSSDQVGEERRGSEGAGPII